jgi:hypothetical protein
MLDVELPDLDAAAFMLLHGVGWEETYSASVNQTTFTAQYGDKVNPRDVMDFMVRDRQKFVKHRVFT